MNNLTRIVRECISDLDSCPIDNLVATNKIINKVIDKLKGIGIVRNVHVGKSPKSFTPIEGVEWYAGQILEALESDSLFAINSLINCVDKFAPKD